MGLERTDNPAAAVEIDSQRRRLFCPVRHIETRGKVSAGQSDRQILGPRHLNRFAKGHRIVKNGASSSNRRSFEVDRGGSGHHRQQRLHRRVECHIPNPPETLICCPVT